MVTTEEAGLLLRTPRGHELNEMFYYCTVRSAPSRNCVRATPPVVLVEFGSAWTDSQASCAPSTVQMSIGDVKASLLHRDDPRERTQKSEQKFD